MLKIDRLAYQSRWRSINPLYKFSAYLLLLLLALCSTPVVQLSLTGVMIVATVYASRVRLRRYLVWLSIPLGFLLFSLLGILLSFSRSADDLLLSVRLGDFYIGVYHDALIIAQHTFCRSLSALTVTYLFVLTTPFDQLIAIGKRCRVPQLLMENALLTYRFIFIFLEEAAAIYQIQTLRFGYSSWRNSYRSLAMLITMLFDRVLTRYRRMTTVLDIKLYNGDFHL